MFWNKPEHPIATNSAMLRARRTGFGKCGRKWEVIGGDEKLGVVFSVWGSPVPIAMHALSPAELDLVGRRA
jgi:hypothetical protein